MAEETAYLLGSGDAELARLAFQHRMWAADAAALWERAGFAPGQTLLDVGCGPGLTSLDLAHLVGPRGRVIAADASARSLAILRARMAAEGIAHVETVEGDLHDLELPPASVDGAYARWVLCYLADPGRVIAGVARALRPGARFATTDYFNYGAFTFAPRSPFFDRVVAAVEEAWRRRGGDLGIQGRTPALMAAAGLAVVDVRQSARVARPGTALWDWPATFFRLFLPTLEEMGLLTAADRDGFWALWEERSGDPNAYLCLPPMVDVVGVRR